MSVIKKELIMQTSKKQQSNAVMNMKLSKATLEISRGNLFNWLPITTREKLKMTML